MKSYKIIQFVLCRTRLFIAYETWKIKNKTKVKPLEIRKKNRID